MDDHTIAPANDSEPSTATQDHKAHNEIEPPQYGRLGHLAYQPDQSHLHNSYWKFQSIDDDRRAAAHGFTTPEELLVVADNSDEKHNDIKIVWTGIAGDPGSRSAIIGTASQHLQTIYELRNLLGLPMSLREQVPLYPTSTDVCLKQYWERKHGEQLPVRTVQAPQAAGQQELLTKTSNPRLANQSCLVSNMSSIQVTSDPTAVGTYNAERTQPVPTYRMFERSATFQNSDEVAQQQESFSTTATFSATDTWSHSELESMTKLPCIDCGGNDDHASGCHIGNLNFRENLTILDYRNLADIVEQFDPGPWTTHFDPYPEPELENPRVQIAGMAEVIRNEDSYKDDPELHDLSDEHMIILWAFKTSDRIEVINT